MESLDNIMYMMIQDSARLLRMGAPADVVQDAFNEALLNIPLIYLLDPQDAVSQEVVHGFMEPVRINLTDSEFSKISTKVMSKKLKKVIGKHDEDVTCSICLEDIRFKQHCKILKCNHVFHKKCISRWLMNECEKPTCPCCRADVRKMI